MDKNKDPMYAHKLATLYGISPEKAQKLVAAGLKRPGDIKRSTKTAIRKLVGSATLKKVRP